MGMEVAEQKLQAALRAGADATRLETRVVGGRRAHAYARSADARWLPGLPARPPAWLWWRADVIHLLGLEVRPPKRRPFLVSVHDLAPLRFHDEGELPPWAEDSLTHATRVVTPSAFAAGEVEATYGISRERIAVVPNGPGQNVGSDVPSLTDAELSKLGLGRPLVLRLGGYTTRKNVRPLLEGWPTVRAATGAHLALVGPAQAARDRLLSEAPAGDGIVVLDYLPSGEVGRLLRTADVLVSTSTYEGFGLPALEAMSVGTPVVGIRSGAIEEVCGDAAELVDDEPMALANALANVLSAPDIRRRMAHDGLARSSRFTWAAAANRLLSVYHEVVREKG
jgi:glycosyltransferase involved in cell wall biosynthesis